MALIVQKYGGTSLGSIEKILNVAQRVVEVHEQKNEVIVVVSAMAGETDRLLEMAHRVSSKSNQREMDVLLSTGEQRTIALLAMAIESMGHQARSFLAHQVRILTDSAFSKARILKIDPSKLLDVANERKIAVVAGFQGIDEDGNLTTLGRGGSDTTAVAIAAALSAEVCEIYTDVDGVYTTDPAICPKARKLKRISYDEMLEMASLGAKVLQIRSVVFAKKYNVPLHVLSSYKKQPGTMVVEEDPSMEKVLVTGVAYNTDEAKVTLQGFPDRPGIAARLFTAIAEADVIVDMIVGNPTHESRSDLTFTVPTLDLDKTLEIVESLKEELGVRNIEADRNISKVSVVGVGMKTHSGVAARMFSTLAREGINIHSVSTSEIKVSCLIDSRYTELAIRALHDEFELENGPAVE